MEPAVLRRHIPFGMLEELLPFYERELGAIRALAAGFAERYPKVARRLQIARDHCEDPDVERLFQVFAWMAARVTRRLDDQVPELAEPLIQMLCPAFTRPVPSATLLQLVRDPREADLPARYTVPRHTLALAPAVRGTRCAFRTTHPVDLWPVAVAGAALAFPPAPGGAGAVLALDLAAAGGRTFAGLGLDRLRFFLDLEPPLAGLLYELLGFRVRQVRVGGAVLPAAVLRPAGFAPEEALFEDGPRTFQGFRLMFEYAVFPEKFQFFQLEGLGEALEGTGERLRIEFHLDRFGASRHHRRLAETLGPEHFKLGCVPAVNLYSLEAAPIPLDRPRPAWPVLAAGRTERSEVYSIDRVRLTRGGSGRTGREVPPFFALGRLAGGGPAGWAWFAARERLEGGNDPGTQVSLALVDPGGHPACPEGATLELALTCSDRDLPQAIPFGFDAPGRADFSLVRHAPVARARPLRRPTASLGPPCGHRGHWRILAHLCMNHLSLANLDREGLQELLDLYTFAGAARWTQGIQSVHTRAATALVQASGPPSFARGTEVVVTVDESRFEGHSLYLFASVLERFLAQARAPTGFVQVTVASQGEGILARFPPRGA